MKAIIVSGGKGERLRPLTDTLPKPMIEVAGRPILEHIINLFKKNGITDFIISVCYLPEKITDYFGNGKNFGVNIKYIYEKENFPLGTAGNIAAARHLIDSTFIVTYADILRDLNIADMVKFHKNKKGIATLNIYKREGKYPKSMVFFDKNSKITKFVERPGLSEITYLMQSCHSERGTSREISHHKTGDKSIPSRFAQWSEIPPLTPAQRGSVGMTRCKMKEEKKDFVWSNGSFYVFEPQIFDFLPNNTFTDFGKDIFPRLLKEGKSLFAYPSTGFFIDIGNHEKLAKARRLNSN